MTVALAADKRFRRGHPARPARRRRLWAAVRVVRAGLVVSLVGYAAYRAAAFAWSAPALRVQTITVRGHEHLSRAEVLALVDGLTDEHVLRVDLDAWRQRVLASPWVRDAALRRALPSTVEIAIRERRPVALARVGRTLFLVDTTGTLIDRYGPDYAHFDLPLVDGLVTSRRGESPRADPARMTLAGALLSSLATRSDLMQRVSQIDVVNPRDAVVILEGDTTLVHLGHEQFQERLQTYVDLAPALHERVPAIEYVDLRFGDRVYVRPVGGSEALASVAADGRPQ